LEFVFRDGVGGEYLEDVGRRLTLFEIETSLDEVLKARVLQQYRSLLAYKACWLYAVKKVHQLPLRFRVRTRHNKQFLPRLFLQRKKDGRNKLALKAVYKEFEGH
jgi:hypothetical protein